MIKIHVIAVAFRRLGELKVFVQSILNQTNNDWLLTIIHDGPNEDFDKIMNKFKSESSVKINFFNTERRYNDYGHSLREIGLKQVSGDYVLLSNADNYLIPKAFEYLIEAVENNKPDVVMFDMVHSHNKPGGRDLPSYSFFETSYKPRLIDVSSAIVKSSLAIEAGFKDKTHDGDVTYFGDILKAKGKPGLVITKIPRILLVHN